MKKLLIAFCFLLAALPAFASPTPTASGVQQSGSVTAGHCAQWLGKSVQVDSGAPCLVYPGAGIPQSTGSAWGTSITAGVGVATALGNATNASGGFITYSGALGTPTSGVAANLTGLPISTGISGL